MKIRPLQVATTLEHSPSPQTSPQRGEGGHAVASKNSQPLSLARPEPVEGPMPLPSYRPAVPICSKVVSTGSTRPDWCRGAPTHASQYLAISATLQSALVSRPGVNALQKIHQSEPARIKPGRLLVTGMEHQNGTRHGRLSTKSRHFVHNPDLNRIQNWHNPCIKGRHERPCQPPARRH